MVRHWNRLLRGTLDDTSLAVFKARLDEALLWWKVSLPWQKGWSKMMFKVPSNPYHPMIQDLLKVRDYTQPK